MGDITVDFKGTAAVDYDSFDAGAENSKPIIVYDEEGNPVGEQTNADSVKTQGLGVVAAAGLQVDIPVTGDHSVVVAVTVAVDGQFIGHTKPYSETLEGGNAEVSSENPCEDAGSTDSDCDEEVNDRGEDTQYTDKANTRRLGVAPMVSVGYRNSYVTVRAGVGVETATFPHGRLPLSEPRNGESETGSTRVPHPGMDDVAKLTEPFFQFDVTVPVTTRGRQGEGGLAVEAFVRKDLGGHFSATNSGLSNSSENNFYGVNDVLVAAGITYVLPVLPNVLGRRRGTAGPVTPDKDVPRGEAQEALDKLHAQFLADHPGVEEHCGPLDPVLKRTADFSAATEPQNFPALVLDGVVYSGWYYSLQMGEDEPTATDPATTYDDAEECYEDADVGAAATAAEPAPATAAARGGDTGSVEGDVAAARAAGVPIQVVDF